VNEASSKATNDFHLAMRSEAFIFWQFFVTDF